MKHLVVGSSFLQEPAWRIMIDEALESAEKGNEVYFAYCAGGCRVCCNNPFGSRIACLFCRFYQRKYLKKLMPTARLVPFRRTAASGERKPFEFSSMADIKGTQYRGVNIGYGVLSSYITWTRELVYDFPPEKRRYFDFLFEEARRTVDFAYEAVEALKPDLVSLYNGRMIEARPFLDLARIYKIPMRGNEIVLTTAENGDQAYQKIIYPDCLPHDIDENAAIAERLWAMPNCSEEEKARTAAAFFTKRRGGVPAGDAWNPGQERTFIKGQEKGLMPDDWDPGKKNIVIFNSSEDEYSSIDPKFDSFSLFQSQMEGVSSICELLADRNDFHVYLRVHPNLSKIPFSYHTDLYKLPEKYPNLTVLHATSKHSTYDLMDQAYKVVVFGSTMGAEAAYWGKTSILVAAALYYKLGFCRTPRTKAELLDDLCSPPRPVEDKTQILKYGYFMVARKYCSMATKHLTADFKKIGLFNKSYWIPAYPKVANSWLATKLVRSRALCHIVKSLHLANPPISLFRGE